MSNIPKLDSRDYKDLLGNVKKLAHEYTPEWNFDENSSDLGVTFSKVFCKMMENTISRYNKSSYNYYLTFLNMLGIKLRPSSSSTGMVVVNALENSDGEYIDKGTQLFANVDTDEGQVVYETTEPLSVVDTSVDSIYLTEPKSDFIGCIVGGEEEDEESEAESSKSFRVFDNVFHENLQCHEIYFGDETVFDMSKTNIEFSFYNKFSAKGQKKLPEIFSDPQNVSWEYYNGKEWAKVDSFVKTDNGVNIKFNNKSQVTTVMGKESRFIRCVFKRVPEGGISLSKVMYRSFSEVLEPEKYIFDSSELDKNDFFPFGEQYNMYNTFSIKCDEAMTKKGATVELSADIQFVKIKTDAQAPDKKYKYIMSEMDFADLQPDDVEIEHVIWEYWNGSGWARLNIDKSSDEFFKVPKDKDVHRSIKFKCPEDIESIVIGPEMGYFIRARISKMRNQFDFYANYITPYIHEMKVKYEYEGEGHTLKELMVRSDMKENVFDMTSSGIFDVMEKTLCNHPAMYFSLSRPLTQGMIRVFVDIEERVHRFNPSLKWEYWAEDSKKGAKWEHIDVMDNTEGFSHSEVITLIGKNNFKKATFFGQTGYFIRIVNPDDKYSDKENVSEYPVIRDMKFNAVRVIQRDTRPPEYFFIEKNEENKVCSLAFQNVSNVSVWVDEIGHISVNEQDEFLRADNELTEAEYDSEGRLEHIWVKWKPVSNLVAYGMDDRVYEIDCPKGEILFGDGRNGKIPPAQYNESIKISYCICSGTAGNIEEHMVSDFVRSFVNIVSVDNPSPIMGGVDKETIDNAARRIFGQISGGNRLVSLSDFEDSICCNDRNIYKVKCLSHVDEHSKTAMGITSVAVLPRKFMQGYEKFQSIKDRIWKYMDEKAPATLSQSSRLRIFEVGYVETSVDLDVVIDDFNAYQTVYKNIETKLQSFLNPVTGNFSGNGWEIGEFPRKEFIYNYIKTIQGIKWIKNINIFTRIITPEGKKEIDFEEVKKKRFVVPVYGEPSINISVN